MFAPVARIEVIRLFLAYAAHKNFTVFQMDVKTAFLNGILKEEVYVGQPPGFVNTQYPYHVYALDKALYVPTPMVEQAKLKLDLIGQPVDHTDYRNMVGSLMYVTLSRPDIMFPTCMCARYQANPNEHHVSAVKRIFRYLKRTINLRLWYPKDYGFDLTAYSDADHVGCYLNRKSTSGSVQFLGDKLMCWSSKKQNCVSISTAESEYVVVSGCCAQVLWMRTQLTDYGFFYDKVLIYYDSKSAIAISYNPVQHTRTKNICVRCQSLLSQLQIHGVGVSTEDANQKFLRSLPSSWSQLSLIMRTKPGVDTLNFDDLYNNLRVFKSDVKGSTGSSSSSQNVAFVSSENTSSSNEVNTTYGGSTSPVHNSQKEGSSSYTDDLMYSFFADQSSGPQLDHEDHEQVDEFDLEEMDLKWQVFMISTRLKKFYKKTRRKLPFDAKEPVGFDKSKTGHAKDETGDYALMFYNSSNSGSNTKMSAKDKSGLGYGSQIHDGVLSYENEIFASVVNRNYMPPKFDFRIDETNLPMVQNSLQLGNLMLKPVILILVTLITLESVPKPVANEPKAVSKPKVWFDAPIIEEYESDSDDEHVTIPSKEQEKPTFAFVNTVEHIKNPRQTVKEQHTCSQNPKPNNRNWDDLVSKRIGLGYGFTKKACFVCGSFSHLNRDCDFHEKRMAKQIELNKKRDNPHQTLKRKGIVDSGCSRHMTGNKAYLVDYQDFNGGPVGFGGIKREYNNARTPQQNGVAERNNMNLSKFGEKSDEGFLVGYSLSSKAFRPITAENKSNHTTGPKETNNSVGTQDDFDARNSNMEANHAQEYYVLPLWSSYTLTLKSSKVKNGDEKLNEDTDLKTNEELVDKDDQAFWRSLKGFKDKKKRQLMQDGIFTSASYDDEDAVADFINLEMIMNVNPIPTSRIHSIHPTTQYLRDPTSSVQTSSKVNKSSGAHAFVDAMQEKLLQFKIQNVWILVDLPFEKKAIGIKWVYRNKKDERGIVVRNKARLVAQGHRQEDEIDYDEVFALVARIEAKRIFLAFASYMGFKVYQMYMKSAFLYGKIDKEVYVSQPLGFIDPKFPNKVNKVVKALYGLHQGPRAWYATLSTFLVQSGYKRGIVDKTLFIKKDKNDIMLMSSMGELTFFLGLQVKQKEDGIFISQDKYVAEILKKFDFLSMKTANTPIETKKPLVKDKEAADVLGLSKNFTSLSCEEDLLCKKPTIVATLTTGAEYVAAASCCG
uniref:Putative ribonuclease H-like domain-containing protein n=1 Tax=Tanacetum cinerariifolium TaxID=118510 RepID=A0A699GWK5_TANCI|nr:putative ribonuclease H-like domain-containing protein [Tanacetum cinerariifolium]